MYKNSYLGDGETSEFEFSFPFFQEADICVAVDNTILDSSEFSINANLNLDGGTVILLSVPAENAVIDIFRQVSLVRTIDYQPTVKIDPENLNSDFNFLLEAFRDLKAIDINLVEWKNIHDNVLTFIDYTKSLIEDKLSGGGVLGIYNNLLSVLGGALPLLINDYGSVTEQPTVGTADDYGLL